MEVIETGLSEYRQHLVLAEQKAQEDYDKALLSLSGGALGISFAFIDGFVTDGAVVRPGVLVSAWLSWALSVALVLASYFVSRNALRKAIKQTDEGVVRSVGPGGAWSLVLEGCNVGAGLAFILGVVLIAVFVWFNLGV